MTIKHKLVLLPLLTLLLSPTMLCAEEVEDFCTRRAVSAVNNIRHDQYPQMSERETKIAHRTAFISCMETRSASVPKVTEQKAVATAVNEETTNREEKKRWIEKLLDNERKEDVSPVMKRHRNGGK